MYSRAASICTLAIGAAAAEDQKSKIYVRVFVLLLRVYSQGGWKKQNQPQPEGNGPHSQYMLIRF
jgi:hypothetical protein